MSRIFLFFLLVSPFISSAQLIKVEGKVWIEQEYCGGANPSPEEIKPKKFPYSGIELLIRKSQSNEQRKAAKKVKCSESGKFTVQLEPGTYCITIGGKNKPFQVPQNDKHTKYKKDCLYKEWLKCNHVFEVKRGVAANVDFTIKKRCDWNLPCTTYSGPLPPSPPVGN